MICTICGNEIPAVGTWAAGNNAQPVKDGRCCDDCNVTMVLPARLHALDMAKRKPAIASQWSVNEGVVWCIRHLLEDGMTACDVGALLDSIHAYIADTARNNPELSPARLGIEGFHRLKKSRE